ncbi:hypothetical protein [Cellvibrio sp. BR]|uniref:hypothetical protein n=1 Tax=Cellvibrio sp. BR TaxID=1134474 RepID=UPI00058BFD73|nr:hypothetical protein [Cellvibrio sp. BR]
MELRSLQQEIETLISFPTTPEAEWVKCFEAASESAIAGAIAHWKRTGSGITGGNSDNVSNKREAAAAILQYRLSNKSIATMVALEKSTTRLSFVMVGLAVVGLILSALQILL